MTEPTAPPLPPVEALDWALDDLLAPPDLEETEAGDDRTIGGAYRLAGLDHADWAARKLARDAARLAEVEDLYRRERAALDTWAAGERARIGRDLEWWEGLLEDWHRREVAAELEAAGAADPAHPDETEWRRVKAKTRRLPSGWTLTATRKAPRLSIDETDGAARFVAWALDHEDEAIADLLKIETTPAKARLNAAVSAGLLELHPPTGNVVLAASAEVVPGLVADAVEVTYALRPPKAETVTADLEEAPDGDT